MPGRAAFQGGTVGTGNPGLADHPSGGFAHLAHHGAQGRIQVFRAADGEGDGLKQTDFLLGAFPFRDVADDATIQTSSFGLPGSERQLQREFRAALFQAVQFDRSANKTLRNAAPDSGLMRASITVRHQKGEWLADDLFAGAAEHLTRGLVAGDHVAVAAGEDDGVGGRLHQRAELLFAFAHGPLGLPTVGHVARHHDGVSDGSFFVIRIITDFEIPPAQRGRLEPILVVHLFPFEAPVEKGFDAVPK